MTYKPKGNNSYGVKLENFNNYKDYRKAYISNKNKFYRSSINGRKILNSHNANRRAVLLKRTVRWANLKAIKEFFINCPIGYAVDHIVPLQGVNVSGLHVLNNLQYLTKSENSIKGNKWI